MAKAKKSIYFCQNCGHEESKWLGQCPMCKEWNTFVEETVDKKSISSSYSGKWCIQRKQRGEAKEPGCDIVQCIDDR